MNYTVPPLVLLNSGTSRDIICLLPDYLTSGCGAELQATRLPIWWQRFQSAGEKTECFVMRNDGVFNICKEDKSLDFFHQKYPDVIVATEPAVFKETSRHFQPCLRLPKQAFLTKSWCFPQNGFVPKPNQSKSKVLWQDRKRTFEPKDMWSCGLQHKETPSLNLFLVLQKQTWKRSPSK